MHLHEPYFFLSNNELHNDFQEMISEKATQNPVYDSIFGNLEGRSQSTLIEVTLRLLESSGVESVLIYTCLDLMQKTSQPKYHNLLKLNLKLL